MKIIPEKYMCEICYEEYDTKKEALACEAKVVPTFQVGTLYGDNTKNVLYVLYEDITFCVAKNKNYQHWNYGSSWACRDNYAGDSLGEETCGTGLRLGKNDNKLDQNQPSFKRMVTWLKSQNIPIFIWDGEKSIPFEG